MTDTLHTLEEGSAESLLEVAATSDVAAAVEAGQRIGRPVELTPCVVATLNPITGETDLHDIDAARRDIDARPPARKRAAVVVRDAESLVSYIHRHDDAHTEVWADLERRSILAVLDGDAPTVAGHGEHRATLLLRATDAWTAWRGVDGRYYGQEEFAELVEARQIDVVEPAGGDLLAIVSTLKATTKADFESSKRLSDGQTVLSYREEMTTKAGRAGNLEVPEVVTLAVAPFEGSSTYRVTARLRVRLSGGRLSLGFVLDRPRDVEAAAFDDVLTAVRSSIDQDVWSGWPTA